MTAEKWLEKGDDLIKRKKYGEALKIFEKAIEINPDFAEAWNGKGVALDDLKRNEDALEAYDKAIDINPDFAEAWNNKGSALVDLTKHEEALNAFEKAIEINPDFAEAWNGKGNALDGLERHEEALNALEKAVDINPQFAKAWNGKGSVLDDLGRYEDALKAYDKALEINPLFPEVWNNKGCTLGQLKRYEEALTAFERAIKIKPGDARAWNNKGNALYELARDKKALKAYDKAIKEDPQLVEAWYNKGIAHHNLRKYKEALTSFEKVIEINSKHVEAGNAKDVVLYAEAWNGKGVALRNLERYEEALTAYEKAIAKGPEYVLPHSNSGDLYFKLGDLKNASEKIEGALTKDKTFAHALMLKGEIEIEKKDYGSANKSFEAAIRSDLGNLWPLLWNAYAKYLKAEFSLNLNDKEYQEEIAAIIRELERANELFKKSGKKEVGARANILYYLGYFYYKNKDLFAAKEKLKECILLKSKSLIVPRAHELLWNIWNYEIRPPWWRWWLSSPLHCRLKRVVFALFLSIPSLLLICTLISANFDVTKVNWPIPIIFIALPIFFLFSPSIKSIKTKEIEIELLNAPPSFELVLTPPKMEGE